MGNCPSKKLIRFMSRLGDERSKKNTPRQTKNKGPPRPADLNTVTTTRSWMSGLQTQNGLLRDCIHGGGFTGGDKKMPWVKRFNVWKTESPSCRSIIVSAMKIRVEFAALRQRTGHSVCSTPCQGWNIDVKVWPTGISRAGSSLWLACHDDLADPTAPIRSCENRHASWPLV